MTYAPSNAPRICDPHAELAMHVRTDGRTNADAWLSTRDHLTFRNARARIRISALGTVREVTA